MDGAGWGTDDWYLPQPTMTATTMGSSDERIRTGTDGTKSATQHRHVEDLATSAHLLPPAPLVMFDNVGGRRA